MSIENFSKKDEKKDGVEALEEKARLLEVKSARLNAEIFALEEEIRQREPEPIIGNFKVAINLFK